MPRQTHFIIANIIVKQEVKNLWLITERNRIFIAHFKANQSARLKLQVREVVIDAPLKKRLVESLPDAPLQTRAKSSGQAASVPIQKRDRGEHFSHRKHAQADCPGFRPKIFKRQELQQTNLRNS